MMRTLVLIGVGIGLAASGAPTAIHLPVKVVYNPSDSAPRGWYRIEAVSKTNALHVGGVVLAILPQDVAALAAQRGYLPTNVPVLKRIGAMEHQSVCVRNNLVRIDGDITATTRNFDGKHRPLRAWGQCRYLKTDELFLLSNTSPASFDSRYFGPIAATAVLGVAHPVWTWSAP